MTARLATELRLTQQIAPSRRLLESEDRGFGRPSEGMTRWLILSLNWIFGTFFSDSTNTSGLLAVALVATVIYLYSAGTQVPDRLLDAVFIIVGFYFGGAAAKKSERPN